MVKKLGICIPYRDREYHLKMLVPHLTKFLNKKGIPHSFYIAHQVDDKLFNRGTMKNIAAEHALNDGCDYIAWHDVDMLPENDSCDYSYPEKYPTHIATAVSKYKYKLNYEQYFGGVVLFNKEHIQKTNGYSNDYWDWGMEDDDLFWRCRFEDLTEDNTFCEYQNTSCFNFNGETSYIKIPKNISEVLSKSHTLSILCKIEEQVDKYKEWLIGSNDKEFVEYPIFGIDNKNSYFIGFNNSRAISSTLYTEDNNQIYSWIKRGFGEWTWVTISVDSIEKKIYFYCNSSLIKNTKTQTLEYSPYEYVGELKNYIEDIFIGKNPCQDCNPIIAKYLKGKIAEIKLHNEVVLPENITDFLKNKKDIVFDLNNNNLSEINDVEITKENFIVSSNNLPYRRNGRFYSLPHPSEGFIDGKWVKGETTAKNEKRFIKEMQEGKINYKEDGISQLKYELVSKEEIFENCFMINVRL